MSTKITVYFNNGKFVSTVVAKDRFLPKIDEYDFKKPMTFRKDDKGTEMRINLDHVYLIEHTKVEDE